MGAAHLCTLLDGFSSLCTPNRVLEGVSYGRGACQNKCFPLSLRESSPFEDIVKSRHARGEAKEGEWARERLRRSLARSRAACFDRPNRRAWSQATSLSTESQVLLSKRFFNVLSFVMPQDCRFNLVDQLLSAHSLF